MSDPSTAPDTALDKHGPDPARPHCANCGAPLYGPYCHVCGQPVKHQLKHLPALAEDALDVVFNLDGRIMHTLPALYLRPGFLAREYFAGRRARYISPLRLVFFLSVLAFLLIQLNLNLHRNAFSTTSTKPHRETPVQVHADRLAMNKLKRARDQPGIPATERRALDAAIGRIQAQADQPRPASGGTSKTPSAARARDRGSEKYGNSRFQDWMNRESSVHVSWLPDFVNERISAGINRGRANLHAMKSGDGAARSAAVQRFLAGTLAVLPQTLFVLLPLFALLLKIVYIFKRRLYIEHLMVALFSHAFIFMTLTLSALVSLIGYALPTWAGTPIGWLQAAIWVWLPIHLLLTQKRVYAQGWFLTVLKYCVLGICYSVLLTFALAVAAAVGLAT